MQAIQHVIPGRDEVASPESITPEEAVSLRVDIADKLVVMDSGLLASLGPRNDGCSAYNPLISPASINMRLKRRTSAPAAH